MRQHVEETRFILRELSDLRCRTPLSPRLAVWFNASLLGTALYALVWLLVWSFERAWWLGLLHLALAPFALVATAVFARTMLELTLAVLQIRDHVVEFGELPRRLGSFPGLSRLTSFAERRTWRISRVESRESR